MNILLLALSILLLLAGCASRPQSPVCNLYIQTEQDLPVSLTAKQKDSRVLQLEKAAALQARSVSQLSRTISNNFTQRQKVKSLSDASNYNILALSAGGQYGAYGSGFLAAWDKDREIIARSDIDMITGVSTGSMMATYAFLGSSSDPVVRKKYDDLLKKTYTNLHTENVCRQRDFLEMLFSNAACDSTPLHNLVNGIVTDELLKEVIAEADKSKRLLYVGAVNLDSGKFEFFDLISIAKDPSHDQRACYAAAILASAAIPVMFEPVFINDSMYNDGGIRRHTFFIEKAAEAAPVSGKKRLFGILHGELNVQPEKPDNHIIDIAIRDVAIAENQLFTDSAYYVDTVAAKKGYERHWTTAARSGCPDPAEHKFDPALGTCLWNKGFNDASQPAPWKALDELLR
jgi:predicted acylesterase/phospholipase RssA